MKFQGSDNYVATQDLMLAVNAAITLKRPLLVKGEPGTGKTMLAEEVAAALGMPLMQWHIKSTTKAQQGLYEYDAVSRLRDSQLGDEKVKDIHNYIVKGVLWQAFTAEQPVALLIDEIDKADIEFPNDLLREIDRMEFYCYETRELVRAKHRPLVFITSNNEKELPDAFLRRCFFHYIKFPDRETMQAIIDVHFPGIQKVLVAKAMVHSPPILVLDEPTAGVDIELRQQLWEYVRELNRRGVTIVLTTHYLEEAEELCERIAIINHGAVAACEPTPKLLRRLNYKTLVVRPQSELAGVPAAFTGLDATIRKDGQLAITYKSDAMTIEQLLSKLREADVKIGDLATEEPDLEDVFVALTSG